MPQLDGRPVSKNCGSDTLTIWGYYNTTGRPEAQTFLLNAQAFGKGAKGGGRRESIPINKTTKRRLHITRPYRPVPIFSTLGKMLESAMAQRTAYLSDTHSLLPYNHFGGFKCRERLNERRLCNIDNGKTKKCIGAGWCRVAREF